MPKSHSSKGMEPEIELKQSVSKVYVLHHSTNCFYEILAILKPPEEFLALIETWKRVGLTSTEYFQYHK